VRSKRRSRGACRGGGLVRTAPPAIGRETTRAPNPTGAPPSPTGGGGGGCSGSTFAAAATWAAGERRGSTLVRGGHSGGRVCVVWRHSLPERGSAVVARGVGARASRGATLALGSLEELARVHHVAPPSSLVTRGVDEHGVATIPTRRGVRGGQSRSWRACAVWRLASVHGVAPLWSAVVTRGATPWPTGALGLVGQKKGEAWQPHVRNASHDQPPGDCLCIERHGPRLRSTWTGSAAARLDGRRSLRSFAIFSIPSPGSDPPRT